MLGYAKKRRRGKGAKKSMQDPDASQDPASQLENPDGQCRGLAEVPGRGLAVPAAKKTRMMSMAFGWLEIAARGSHLFDAAAPDAA